VSRRVEQRSPDEPWATAFVGQELREGDGVRTAKRSSAAVTLADGSELLVSEASSVFLRAPRRRQGAEPGASAEIGDGQADLRSRAAASEAGLELVIGATSIRTRGGEAPAHVRGRRTRSSLAQVMAYAGTVDVETPGGRLTVPEGTGSIVRRYEAPSRPEVLLPAPRLGDPAAGAFVDHSNPTFRWRPVEGAASYVVEVCRDEVCGVVLERVAALEATQWTVHRLALGTYYWRVTAVAASGLDGYPAKTSGFEVKALWRKPVSVMRGATSPRRR
jgi:hypothetical protein